MVSQLKVNEIIKQSGSSVTIGEAGDTITFPSSGTASGIFTSTPSAYIQLGTDQTISNATWTKVNLNTSNWDTDSGFDSSNYKYTIPTTGKYQINYSAYISGLDEGEYCQARIYKNGSTNNESFARSYSQNNIEITVGRSYIFSFTANDYLELYVYQNSGSDSTCYSEFTAVSISRVVGV